MSAQVIQALVLGLVALLSVLFSIRHVMPGVSHRVQSGLARFLGQSRRGRIAHAIGRWLQPAEASRGSCGSGHGCASCGGCGSSSPDSAVESIGLKLEPRIPPSR